MSSNPIIWQPDADRVRASAMYRFMQEQQQADFNSLYQWSVDSAPEFWQALAVFCEIEFDEPAAAILQRPTSIANAGWFSGAKLNFARHMLRHSGSQAALVFCGEDGIRTAISRDQLRQSVADVAEYLRQCGVVAGDRVAGFVPNGSEAAVAMLAAASIGAIWSSCSPDFGTQGVLDRFSQIEPKVFFACNGYQYNGKIIDTRETVTALMSALPSLRATVIIPFVASLPETVPGARSWGDFPRAAAIDFQPVDFSHPLYIMFSSGTTGAPKCIVHGHGGTLLQQSKEHVLHTDVSAADRLFYFTTCGWMMWNWLMCGLGTGATLVLFDGAPFFRDGRILWEIAERERVSVFGTSAKYLSALQNTDVRPRHDFDLGSLKTILSTGSPLSPESFDYVYETVAQDVQLSSISGGTDILSCFALGNPVLPVRRGELQCRGLGMAVEIYSDDGESLVGETGELVCTKPFPSAPLGFWNDSDGSRYRAAYFERFPGTWAQGDFAELAVNGGMVIHGRSDAVLNPGGVRIGTAEIYRQVERLDEVLESIAIGQNYEDDVRVVLFVVLQEGIDLDDDLVSRIRATIRANTTPRHVPAVVLAVPDIPRTKSGKIVELAVRDVVHGRTIKNVSALANPEALAFFANREELNG